MQPTPELLFLEGSELIQGDAPYPLQLFLLLLPLPHLLLIQLPRVQWQRLRGSGVRRNLHHRPSCPPRPAGTTTAPHAPAAEKPQAKNLATSAPSWQPAASPGVEASVSVTRRTSPPLHHLCLRRASAVVEGLGEVQRDRLALVAEPSTQSSFSPPLRRARGTMGAVSTKGIRWVWKHHGYTERKRRVESNACVVCVVCVVGSFSATVPRSSAEVRRVFIHDTKEVEGVGQ